MSSKAFITSLATAVPQVKIDQSKAAAFMIDVLDLKSGEDRKIRALYRATGNKFRYSVLEDFNLKPAEFTFFSSNGQETEPDVGTRMLKYRQEAVKLASQAVERLKLSNIKDQVTHLITVSCTGLYAPGLDIELLIKLGLNESIHRTCINFMGCYAAINGLKTAQSIVKSNPEAKVLVVCVELCSLHFQKKTDEDSLLANALFADGAAALMVESSPQNEKSLEIQDFQCALIPEGSTDMAWNINAQAFEMRLSSYIPQLIKNGLGKLWAKINQQNGSLTKKMDFFAIHPGGRRILEAVESELNLSKEDNRYAYKVLENYGNMSSPTILFVIHEIISELKNTDQGKSIFGMAFGPGLTVETVRLEVASL